MELTEETRSPESSEDLGCVLGALLRPGDVIDLRGALGAGKTCFTRGLARGLGISDPIRSPTFTICHVHRGTEQKSGGKQRSGGKGLGVVGEPISLFHIDAYRLEDPEELLIQGWDEMRSIGVIAIEWGERVPELLPDDRVVVAIEHVAVDPAKPKSESPISPRRRFSIRSTATRSLEIVTALAARPPVAGSHVTESPLAKSRQINSSDSPGTRPPRSPDSRSD